MSAASPGSVIHLDGVGVRFRSTALLRRPEDFWAVRDLSFDVAENEILAVVGRNGAGKSTLMRVVAGIIAPDEGNVDVRGTAMLLSLQLGFTTQLSGLDNILQSGILMGLTLREISARAPDIVEFSELGNAIHRPLSTYSSGMRSRLGFSIALHSEASIILIDETLAVGDAWFQRKSRAALEQMLKDSRTVLLASHNTNFLKAMSQRTVWIEDGRLCAVGESGPILDEYTETTQRRR